MDKVKLWRQIRDFINKQKPSLDKLVKIANIVGYEIKEEK